MRFRLISCFIFGLVSNFLFSQNFSRYAPSIEQNIGAGMVEMLVKPDGSMTFLAPGGVGGIYGNVIFRAPNGSLSSTGLYKCGSDLPPLTRIVAHPDGGYYLLGIHQHFMGDPLCGNFHFDGMNALSDLRVLRIDAVGNVLWVKSLGGTKAEGLDNVALCADGSLVIFAHSASTDGDNSNTIQTFGVAVPWVLRLNSDGTVRWDFHPLQTQASNNYKLTGLELSNGEFMVFNVEAPKMLQVYRLNADGMQLSKTAVPFPNDVQGFKQALPLGSNKVLLGGTGDLVDGSFNRAPYLMLLDWNANKLAERFLKDQTQDHYFESMFVQNNEVLVAGSFYNFDHVSISALELGNLEISSTQKFKSSQVPYVHTIAPLSNNRVAVLTDVQPDNDFQWMQTQLGFRGFVEFETCGLSPDFSFSNLGNNKVQFTNTSGGNAIDFVWTFGSAGSAFSENPSFTFPTAGIYPVCLSITNSLLCTSEICKDVWVGASSTEEAESENIEVLASFNHLTVKGLSKKSAYRVFNSQGQLVGSGQAGAGQHTVDISGLQPGVFVLVLDRDAGVTVRRFLKN